jgi:transcriptional regulator GlxA family with amidase domain
MPQGSSQDHRQPGAHRVVVVVDENSNPFEVGCACEIFGARRPEIGRDLYRFRVCAPVRRVRMRDGFFTLSTTGSLHDIDTAGTVIVPNRPDVDTAHRPAVLGAIRRAHARGARLVGLCTGAFTLAEAGVLEGRRATVHWQLAAEFKIRYPGVDLEPDVLFVDDGDVLTSAGSAAALDLALHIVRRDHGAEIANHVSRRLVFAAFRDGGQRQFVERPVPDLPAQSLAPLLTWAQRRLDQKLTVTAMARYAGMSAATLHRRFQAELGTTPWAWLTSERVTLACRLIEHGALTVDAVARHTGLGTTANLRDRVKRQTGLSPSAYRARFATGHPASSPPPDAP